MLGAGREAIVFTAHYVMQRGAKAGHTVGLRYHLDLMERNPELKARTFQRVRQALDCL